MISLIKAEHRPKNVGYNTVYKYRKLKYDPMVLKMMFYYYCRIFN